MLKDIFGSLGFVIVGSDILFWAYFFIMDNTCIPFVLINDRKMIDAKHVHKLLECKYDFKHWIKDVISSFNFKDGIDYISYRYDNNGEQIIDNNSHVFRHDYYLFPKSILCIIYMKCDRSLFKDLTSLSAHQYTIRNCVLWIETPLYTISTCGIRNSS